MMIDEEGPPTLAVCRCHLVFLAVGMLFLVLPPTSPHTHSNGTQPTPRALLNCGPKKTQEGIEFDSHQNVA